jgi:hypothetical protein
MRNNDNQKGTARNKRLLREIRIWELSNRKPVIDPFIQEALLERKQEIRDLEEGLPSPCKRDER